MCLAGRRAWCKVYKKPEDFILEFAKEDFCFHLATISKLRN